MEAAASLVPASDVPLAILLHFISTLPREVTDYGGRKNIMAYFINSAICLLLHLFPYAHLLLVAGAFVHP